MIVRVESKRVPPAFENLVLETLVEITTSPTFVPLLEEFQASCQFRARFKWLPESGRMRDGESQADIVDNALIYGLRYALAAYIPKDKNPTHHFLASPESSSSQASRSEAFARAIQSLPDGNVVLTSFSDSLSRVLLDHENIDRDAMRRHIIAAMHDYCEQKEIGTSPDPW